MTETSSVKLNPFEREYLDKNNLGFSEYVHNSFYRDMKQDYHNYIKKIGIGISLCLFGMICFALSYLVFFLFLYLSIIALGLFFCLMGFYIVGWEVKNGRR